MNEGDKIQNCTLEFVFQCPKVWSALSRTGNKLVRHCNVCEKEVHYCESLQDARQKSEQEGLCIALSKQAESELRPRRKPRFTTLRLGRAKVSRVPKPEPADEKEDWKPTTRS